MISSLNAVDEWTTPLVVPVDASLSGVTMRSLSNAVFVIDASPSRPQMWRVDDAKAALQALGLVDPALLAAAGQQGCATDADLLLWGREYQAADGKVLNQSAAEGQLGTVGELPSQSGLRLQLVASDGTTTDLPSVNGFTVGSGQLGCAENGLVLLARRTTDSHSAFACLLVGQPTLRRRIKLGTFAALDQRIALRFAMPPMNDTETASYIAHHLSLAGRTDSMFSDDATALIHQVARGLPRAVNNLAIQALVAAYAERKNIVDETSARAAVTETTAD